MYWLSITDVERSRRFGEITAARIEGGYIDLQQKSYSDNIAAAVFEQPHNGTLCKLP